MYYQLTADRGQMSTFITPDVECSESLIVGEYIDPAGEQLPFKYTYRSSGELFDFFPGDCLMSVRMLELLQALGVDNVQRFDAELLDGETGKTRSDYTAINIVGLVSCAVIEESDTSEIGSSYYFHKLVIDPDRVGALRLFRLAESLTDILVNETIARGLKTAALRGVILRPVKESAGTA